MRRYVNDLRCKITKATRKAIATVINANGDNYKKLPVAQRKQKLKNAISQLSGGNREFVESISSSNSETTRSLIKTTVLFFFVLAHSSQVKLWCNGETLKNTSKASQSEYDELLSFSDSDTDNDSDDEGAVDNSDDAPDSGDNDSG
jgi:hypothetical protein